MQNTRENQRLQKEDLSIVFFFFSLKLKSKYKNKLILSAKQTKLHIKAFVIKLLRGLCCKLPV